MKPFRLTSVTEQVAERLQAEIEQGLLVGRLPGAKKIAERLGVDHKTVYAAADLLENKGFLKSQGAGKSRLVTRPKSSAHSSMRVVMLPFSADDSQDNYIVEIQHRLIQEGHHCLMLDESLMDLNMDPKRVARLVSKTEADAWIVVAASREVLEWFAEQDIPTFALFGNLGPLPLAYARPEKAPAVMSAVNELVDLGHRRIVWLIRQENLIPEPLPLLLQFLKELESRGIPSGRYNLPLWEDHPEGLQQCLESLFQHTPPTALMIDEPSIYFVVQQFLAKRGIMTPRDLSLICLGPHPTFNWLRPKPSHIDYQHAPWVRRIVDWSRNIAQGKDDRKQEQSLCQWILGETVGPV